MYGKKTVCNEYDVWFNGGEVGSFTYNWLGAPVRFKLFGKWREGSVIEVDDFHGKNLTASLWDGTKRVTVWAPYQAFRKVKDEDRKQEAD